MATKKFTTKTNARLNVEAVNVDLIDALRPRWHQPACCKKWKTATPIAYRPG
jgi:hypothetical protein